MSLIEGMVIVHFEIGRGQSLELVPNQNIKIDPGITLNPKNGIKMKLRMRSNREKLH